MNNQGASSGAPLCAKISRAQVDAVVRDFYAKLLADPDMRGFFAHIEDFGEHERHIASFWWWAMGGRGEPTRPFDMKGRHYPLGLDEAAFAKWLETFQRTLEEHLAPDLAQAWFELARGIGANLKRMTLDAPPPFVVGRG